MASPLSQHLRKQLITAQRIEITEHLVYKALARLEKKPENSSILSKIAEDEKRHARFWEQHTGVKAKPYGFRAWLFVLTAKVLGLTFALKLMERGEERAQINYQEIVVAIPEGSTIVADEARHEHELLAMLNEERLDYIGSIVLGLNDALVELTGALAGLSFALQNSRLIGFAGLITGIAASLSMAASDYLSHKAEGNKAKAATSALYTGMAYIITVILLVLPYLLGLHFLVSLAITLSIAVAIIAFFTYYLSVAKDQPFLKHFAEMAGISLGVSALTFGIGWAVRTFFGIEV